MAWSKAAALARICEAGVIPILRLSSMEEAWRAAEAILDTGIGIIEITMGVPDALRVVERIVSRYGDAALVGVGTVIEAEACRAAMAAGADFIVAPNFDLNVVAVARGSDKVCIPGALTPTEVMTAWRGGADMVKIFPCGLVGGPKYIRALRGPLPHIELVPTGGITLGSIAEFVSAGVAAVGIGGELLSPGPLDGAGLERIRTNVRNFLEAVRSARMGLPHSSATR
jgi:2-dehydro-3-deoxyphosphogluconate aldolase / (4S)-4-hydroxy-2-oxoglutarate aldolase